MIARLAPWMAIATLGAGCLRIIEIPFPRSNGALPWHLKAVLYRPEGPGPFPLAVINHGSAFTAADRRWPTSAFAEQSAWFVKRGFVVVVPSRRGYGGSDGPYAESFGSCEDADYRLAGLQTARDIWVVIKFMSRQAFVDGRRVIVVGHSAGGFGSLALASLNPPGLRGVINFAGGRGSIRAESVCAPAHARAAFFAFGRTSKIPSLWLYSRNDAFFGPGVARAWYEEYRRAGGQALFVNLPPDGVDGHQVFADASSMSLWTGPVAQFLSQLGFAPP